MNRVLTFSAAAVVAAAGVAAVRAQQPAGAAAAGNVGVLHVRSNVSMVVGPDGENGAVSIGDEACWSSTP